MIDSQLCLLSFAMKMIFLLLTQSPCLKDANFLTGPLPTELEQLVNLVRLDLGRIFLHIKYVKS